MIGTTAQRAPSWRASHGFSDTRFGMRYLNRVQSRAEDRYLKARVSLTELGIKAALETLTGRLRDNGVVSFTAQRYTRRPTVVPFLDGEITWRPAPR